MKRTGLLLVLLTLIPLLGRAQLRIGVFDRREVLNQLEEIKSIEAKLQDYAQKRETDIGKRVEAFQAEVDAFQKRATTLPDAKRKEEEARLATKRQELSELGQSAQLDVQKKQEELMKPLMDRISASIRAVALEQKLDFVFNKTSGFGESYVLYTDEARKASLDITPKVIEKLKKP